jgi:hypothetical protein
MANSRGTLSYRQKRKPFLNPRLLIIVLVIIFLLLCLIGRGTFSNIGCSNNTGAVQNYINQVKKIADRTNKVGTDFADMRTNIKSLARKDLQAKLDKMTKDSNSITADAKKIEVPTEMGDANRYLLVALEMRGTALESYKPAIFNALGDNDLEVSAKQVSRSLKDVAFSDRAFGIFKDDAQKVLKDKAITFVSAPASVWLTVDGEYEVANVLVFLQAIKTAAPDLTETHGIAISDVILEPASTADNNGVGALPNTNTVSVSVTIENQGNQIEVNIPIVATLKSETQPKPQQKKNTIASLAPGEKKTIKITGLTPTKGDIVNMLTIQAGPVPNEKFLDNNMSEIKFTVAVK